MRGSKAKKLRKIAFGDGAAKYSRNREYKQVVCPGQHRHGDARTIIADSMRFYYQSLKGRRMSFGT